MSKARGIDFEARARIDRPHALEHASSVLRRAAQPKGLGGLLVWFLTGFRAEMPEAVHAAGVWRDYVRLDEDRAAEGGSLLGSPRLADPFRALIEGSPFATEPSEFEGHASREGDEHYRTPMRAAIARLRGRHTCTRTERTFADHRCGTSPFMALTVERIAYLDGDWESAAASLGIHPETAATWVAEALFRLWRVYDERPPARLDDGGLAAAV
jgi:hypothetical protein